MRVGAGWIYEKEFGSTEEDPTWIGIGFIAAEPGALLLLIAIVLGGLSARKLRKDGGTMGTMGKITTVLATLLFVVYLIAVWAMGAKPTSLNDGEPPAGSSQSAVSQARISIGTRGLGTTL